MRGSAPAELRAGIFGGGNYSRLMPDWPTETITDQDPRYRELLAQEAEARVRFLASEQAREEMARLAAQKYPTTTWKPAQPLSGKRQRVYRWD